MRHQAFAVHAPDDPLEADERSRPALVGTSLKYSTLPIARDIARERLRASPIPP